MRAIDFSRSQQEKTYWLIWLILALNFYVRIEPAPCDVVTIATFFIFLLLGMRVPRGLAIPGLLLGIYILGQAIGAVIHPDPVSTLRQFMVTVYMVLLWILFSSIIASNPRLYYRAIWSGYSVAAWLSVIIGMLMFFNVIHVEVTDTEHIRSGDRVLGLFKDPNVFAPFLVPIILYSYVQVTQSRGLKVYMSLISFAVYSVGILAAASRGAWMNLAISFVVLNVFQLVTNRGVAQYLRMIIGTAGGAFIACAVLVVTLSSAENIRELLDSHAHPMNDYDYERFDNQSKLFKVATSTPLGLGPTGFRLMSNLDPHNQYLQTALESGWVGAVAFYAFLIVTVIRCFKFCMQPTAIQSEYLVVYSCIIGTLVQSWAIDTVHWRHFVMLWGMAWGPLLAWHSDRAFRTKSTWARNRLDGSVRSGYAHAVDESHRFS